MQICSWYSATDTVVRNFFFGSAKYKGTLNHNDKAILAVEGPSILGGVLVREGQILCLHAEKLSVREQLSQKASG